MRRLRAGECGVEPELMVTLAREFTSHGKRASAELYRGAVQHTNVESLSLVP